MIKNRLMAMAVTAAIVIPNAAMATNGMFMMGNGTKANGRVGVGIAMADSAISGADNPAAMVRVGNRVDFGVQIFDPDRTSEVSGSSGHPLSAIPGNPFQMPSSYDFKGTGNGDGPFYIPEMAVNYMISDDLAFGVTVVGTGGMNTNYESIMMFNGPAFPHDVGINFEQVRILPTLSYMINDQHSIGASLQIAYQQFKAWGLDSFTGTNSTPVPSPPGPPGFVFDPQTSQAPNRVSGKGRDDALGFGLSLGWQGQLTDSLTVGVVYNSKIDMDEMDDYRGLLAEDGSMDVPENYGIGLAFQATDKLLLGFDIQQINYSGVDSIGNSLQGGNGGMDLFNPAYYLGTDDGSGFGWNDMTVYKLGVEYQQNAELTLRAGWSHTDQPVDDDQTMFNILAPAVIEDHVSIGMTYKLPNESELSMFYMHAFSNTVKGSNSIPMAFGGGEADIEMSQNAFGLAYGWNF
ncbi:MAG: outer membrane protein transport protein [gamma proteobacterium symbiont of Taylorina sp.]|nr:outer membrane protein transport protein [gamma proteobacterium symbiont of Taylorina sp.]